MTDSEGPYHICKACGKPLSKSVKLKERKGISTKADYGEAWEDVCHHCKTKTWESYRISPYEWNGLWNGLEEKGRAY